MVSSLTRLLVSVLEAVASDEVMLTGDTPIMWTSLLLRFCPDNERPISSLFGFTGGTFPFLVGVTSRSRIADGVQPIGPEFEVRTF